MLASLSRMHRRKVTLWIALATLISQSDGYLVLAPNNTESKINGTAYFNCSTNLTDKEIFWHHDLAYVYTGGGFIDPYHERFEIDRNASKGSHNLVIHSVKASDAGKYICIDDDGHGERRSAELVVLDGDPDCQSNIQPDGVIGQNIFNIPLDEVQLTCNVTYNGNIPPQMEWKKIGENRPIKDNVTSIVTSKNRLISILMLKGDISLDNSSYVCQAKNPTLHQYNCTSATIRVLYFFGGNTTEQDVFRGKEITCATSNSTFPCISQWYHGNYSCPLSCDETITALLLGEYLCTLKCNIRGKDYYFEALKAVVVEATTSPPSKAGTIATSVMVPIACIILVIVICVCGSRYKKRKKRRNILRQIRVKNEEQKVEWLLTMNLTHNPYEALLSNDDDVAEEEIQLLYKIKKEEIFKEQVILGVAILGGKLFLVHEDSEGLEVYDIINYLNPAFTVIKVKDVSAAVDICSCKIANCLYIMDKKHVYTSKEIVKFTSTGALLKKWRTTDNAKGNLSATTEGNVIITVQEKHLLLEYSADGVLVRTIKLSGCNNPWRAIKLSNGRYVVSHGTLFDPLHRVCEVDEEGKVEKSFGLKSGSTEGQLNIPYYLDVASNGCVLVADLCNNRVLLLDSNLKFKSKIIPKYGQGFRSPRRIYLNEGRLVVLIGEGIPKYVYKPDLKKETEPQPALTEKDNSKEKFDGQTLDSVKETEEGIVMVAIDHSKETIDVEPGEVDTLVERANPKEANPGAARPSSKKSKEAISMKVIDELIESLHVETDAEIDMNNILKEIDDWRNAKLTEVDVSDRIENDCRLIVFDIQPLLQKYND